MNIFKQALDWYTSTKVHQWWVEKIWKPSWSKLTTAVYGIPAAIVAGMEALSHFANDTTIQGYLAKLSIPNWVPMMLTTVALIQYIAAGRN